eukprot:gene13033-29451_t
MLLLASLCLLATGAYRFQPDQSIEYLLSLTQQPGGAPPGIPSDFDCAWRNAALPYAKRVQPSLSKDQQKQLHDALQLTVLCGVEFAPVEPAPLSSASLLVAENVLSKARTEIYVDAAAGSDSNTGTTISNPLQTLAAAVAASRKVPGHGVDATAAIIQLRKGVYYLSETIVLQEADSGLTITAYKGEEAELSGGLPLSSLQWTPSSANPKIHTTKVPKALLSGAAIRALHINGVRATLARYPNSNPELDLFPDGYIANKT